MITTSQIADAVTAALNDPGTTWGQSFAAERTFLPEYDLADDALHVAVVPKVLSSDIAGRASIQSDHQVDVGVLKRLDSVSNATVDPLVALLTEVRDTFLAKAIDVAGVQVVCTAAAVSPLYSPDSLRTKKQYIGVITLTFRLLEVVT